MDRLATDAKLTREVSLRDALFHEREHQISTLRAKSARDPRVLDRLGPDFLYAVDQFLVLGGYRWHAKHHDNRSLSCQPYVDGGG